jgi:protease I
MRVPLLILLLSALGAVEAPRVLILTAEGFNPGELWQPRYALHAAGISVTLTSPGGGPVAAGSTQRDHELAASGPLAGIDPAVFDALLVPGGHAPERLEPLPLALATVRAFFADHRPVATICHGPRLLEAAGVLGDRVATGWWEVASEIPVRWVGPGRGAWVDRPLVRDGNLLSARYPGDGAVFSAALVAQVAAATEHPVPRIQRRVVVLDLGAARMLQWAVAGGALQALGAELAHRPWYRLATSATDLQPRADDAVVVLDGGKRSELDLEAILEPWRAAGATILALGPVPGFAEPLPAEPFAALDALVLRLAQNAVEPAPTLVDVGPVCYLALAPGCDGAAAAAATALAELAGYHVVTVGPEQGWLRGVNGLPLETTRTYAAVAPGRGDLLVLPGGPGPAVVDAARAAWAMDAHERGAALLSIGLDGLTIGLDPRNADRHFATSEQAEWSFGKQGGRYHRDPVVRSAAHLVSARDRHELAAAWRLLHEEDEP